MHVRFYSFVSINNTIRLREGELHVRVSDLLEGAPDPVLQAIAHILLAKLYKKTIARIQDPVAWNPDDPTQLTQLMTAVNGLEPWNESPIVHTIMQAREDLRDVAGFKTILVITDGMDNRFDKDREINPRKKDVPTFLRKNVRVK